MLYFASREFIIQKSSWDKYYLSMLLPGRAADIPFDSMKELIEYVYENCNTNLSLEDTLRLAKLYNEQL